VDKIPHKIHLSFRHLPVLFLLLSLPIMRSAAVVEAAPAASQPEAPPSSAAQAAAPAAQPPGIGNSSTAQTAAAVPVAPPAIESSGPQTELEQTAQEISESMMSPFCPGRTISSCPSPQARELRAQILEWLQSGYSPEAVRKQLLVIYGGDIKGEPDKAGFGLVGWLMPSIFVLLAFAVVFFKLRRMKYPPSAKPQTADAEARRKVELELKKRMNI
jgi:cytochrome c-type biogenesis protein CcmH/NrfF